MSANERLTLVGGVGLSYWASSAQTEDQLSFRTMGKAVTRTEGSVEAHVPRDPDDVQCNGKKSGKVNEYCQRPPGWGTDHPGIGRCKWHGGAAPNYAKKAQELEAAKAVQLYGLPVDIDPHIALLDELARTHGHVLWLRQRVGEIQHSTVTATSMVGPVGGGPEAIPGYEPNVWIRMYNEERDRLTKVAATCIKAGIAERQMKLAEWQGQAMATVLKNVLTRLEVIDHPDARQVVREELAAASGSVGELTA